jgi:hypothetical protein
MMNALKRVFSLVLSCVLLRAPSLRGSRLPATAVGSSTGNV